MLREQKTETDILYDALKRLAQADTPQQQLEAISDYARDNGAFSGAMYSLESSGSGTPQWVEIVARWHLQESAYPVGTRFSLDEFPYARLFLSLPEQPLLDSDVSASSHLDETTRSLYATLNIRASATLSLRLKGCWVGVVLFHWDAPHTFDERDMRIYSALAQQTAVAVSALRPAQLPQNNMPDPGLNDATAALASISAAVNASPDVESLAETLLSAIKAHFKRSHAQMYVLDESGQTLMPVGSDAVEPPVPLDHPSQLVAAASRSRQIAITNQEDGINGQLAVPLLVGDWLIGVLAISDSTPNGFSEVERHIITALANQAAVAIQNLRPSTPATPATTSIQSAMGQVQDFRLALDESGMVVITDPAGIIQDVNANFCQIARYSREELIGQDSRLLSSGYHPKEFIRELWRTISGGKVWRGEFRNRAKDGAIFWAETTIVPLLDGRGKPRQFMAIQFDVTSTKSAQEHAQQRASELEVVTQVSAAAAAAQDTNKLLQTVVDLTKARFKLYHAQIYLLDEAGQSLSLAAGAGQVGRLMKQQGHTIPLNHPHSLVANVARNREAEIANDVSQNPNFPAIPMLRDARAELAVPMVVGDHLIGVLDVLSDRTNRFEADDIRIKSALAAQVAVAIQNARAYAQLKKAEETLRASAEIYRAFARNFPNGAIFLYDHDLRYTLVDGQELSRLGHVKELVEGKTLWEVWPAEIANQIEGPHFSALIGNPETCEFNLNDETWLQYTLPVTDGHGQVIAGMAILQIITERKLTETEIHRHAFELETLARVADVISGFTDTDALLQSAVDMLQERFNLYHAQIYLTDTEKKNLTFAAGTGSTGQSLKAQGRSIAVNQTTSIIANAARNRAGVVVDDTTKAPNFLPNPLLPETRSEIAVPILIGQDVIGVLDVQVTQPNSFADEALSLYTVLASQIASAIQNTRVFQAAEHAQNQYQLLADYTTDVVAIQAPDGVYTYISPAVQALTGYVPEELAGHPAQEFYHPEDTALTEGTAQYRMRRKDGGYIWVETTSRAVRDPLTGETTHIQSVSRDVSERKQAEADLIAIQTRLRESNQLGGIGRFELDVTTNELRWDDRFYELLHVDPSISASLDVFANAIASDDRAMVLGALRTALDADQEGHTFEFAGNEGEHRHFRAICYVERDTQGNALKLLGTIQDITVRKRAEAEIQQRAADLAAVADISAITARMLDLDELLQAVCDLTKERFNHYHAHIFLLDETGQQLKLAAGAAEPGRIMKRQGRTISYKHPQSLVAHAARVRRTIVENNVLAAAEYSPNPLLPETRAEMSVPLVVGDRLVGVLDIHADRLDAFSDVSMQIHVTLANQIAIAVQNARAYASLQEALRRMGDLQFAMDESAIVAMTDQKGAILHVNDKFCQISKYPRDELLGKDHRILNSGHHPAEYMRRLWANITQGHVWRGELCNRAKDQSLYWVDTTIVPLLGADGTPREFIAISADITERKQHESALASRARELATMAAVSAVTANTLDVDKLLLQAVELTKERFQLYHAQVYLEDSQLLSLSAGTGEAGQRMMTDKHTIDVNHPQSLIAQAARTREVVIANEVTESPEQAYLPQTASELAVPMAVADRLIGVLDVRSEQQSRFSDADVLVHTALANQLAVAVQNARLYQNQQHMQEEAQSLAQLKTAFLTEMSQAIHSPLNAIIGFAEVILDGVDGDLPDEATEDVQSIHDNSKRLLTMVNNILDLANIESGQLKLTLEEANFRDVAEEVMGTATALAKRKGVELALDVPPDVPNVHVDRIRLRQILNNLISNAIQFTQKGQVGVWATFDPATQMVQVACQDSGIGIENDRLQAIFERPTDSTPHSLGLVLTHQLVALHGGKIWVESTFGVGSTFRFTIPRHESARQEN